jgi:hypothetical protein
LTTPQNEPKQIDLGNPVEKPRRKNVRNPILALCAILVAGCSDSDINAVKEGRFDAYPEFTISQAFDNRAACDSTDWEKVTDSRDREIVRYTCHFKGVGDAFLKQAKKEFESATKHIDSRTFSYEVERISKAKAMIASIKEEMAIAEAALAQGKGPNHDEINEKYSPIISQLEKILQEIESNDVKTLVSKGVDHFNWPEGYESFKTSGLVYRVNQMRLRIRNGVSPDSSEIIARSMDAERQKPQYEESLRRRIKELTSERDERLRSNLSSAKRNVEKDFPARIASEQDDIDSTEARMAKDIQDMNTRLERAKHAMENAHDSSAFEYFEWTISEDGSLYTVGGGIMLRAPGETELKPLMEYSDYHAPLNAIYENGATEFAEYYGFVSTKSLLRTLGH